MDRTDDNQAGTAVHYVEGHDVRRTPFRVAVSPLPSLALSTRYAFAAPGAARARADAIRRHLRWRDLDVLAPFVAPTTSIVPDALVGLGRADETLTDAIERLIATPASELEDELATCRAAAGDERWRAAEQDPVRWIRRYAAALLRAWRGFEPAWRDALPALYREVERVGVAIALDAQLELLDRLMPTGRVVDGRWCVNRCIYDAGRVRFPETGLLLTPAIAGRPSQLRIGDVISAIIYPVDGTRAPAAGAPAARLEALLGRPRAQILRAVARPTGIGTLARMLQAVPSAATHHVRALEEAGLVERERQWRSVLVRRTARGDTLVELYDGQGRARRAPR